MIKLFQGHVREEIDSTDTTAITKNTCHDSFLTEVVGMGTDRLDQIEERGT